MRNQKSYNFLIRLLNVNRKLSLFFHEILYAHSEGEFLDEKETAYIIELLKYHQKSSEKIGNGVDKIKIGKSPQHLDTRCFIIVRKDNSEVDFSYMKCTGEIPLPEKKEKSNSNTKRKKRDDEENDKKTKKQKEFVFTSGCVVKIIRGEEEKKKNIIDKIFLPILVNLVQLSLLIFDPKKFIFVIQQLLKLISF